MIKLVRLVIAVCLASTLHFTAASQSLSVNTTGATAAPSSILDVSSTAKGVLVPRMDKTQKNAIASPDNGLLVYQTGPDSIGFHYYDLPNTQWVFINASGFATDTTAWKITGNSNITSQHFLGTLNDSALRFRIKNIPSGILDSLNTAFGFRALSNNTATGKLNTAYGYNSSLNNTTGVNNVAIGHRSLAINDTAKNNVAIGYLAGYYNNKDNNVAIGSQAGTYWGLTGYIGGKENTAVGTEAAHGAFTMPKTTAIGYRAMYSRSGGTIYTNDIGRNTAIGDSALAFAGYGYSNVAVGNEALSRVHDGYQNVAIGDSSLGGALSTVGNVAIGYKTLSKQQAQGWNTAVGYYSQRDSSKSTYYNTSIGAYSMEFNRTGVYNTGLGLSSLRLTDSASYNTAVGADAMYYHKKNGSNLAAGAFAMRGDSAGYWNTAVGSEAMDRFGSDGTARGTGFSNVAVGFRALRGAREAFENTAVGVGALESDSSGNYNTAVGRYSSFLNKRGDFNVSLGFRASNNADTASSTTAIGSYAGAKNKQDNNVTIGYAAGYEAGAVGGYDPKEITFVGYEAGRGAWASNKNTSLGFRALSNTDAGFGFYDYVTGRNTAIGDSAMAFSIGGSNVVVGAEALANTGLAGTWNNVAIGDSAMGAALSNSGALADNVAIGFRSLTQVKNQGNIAIGAYSGRKLANTIWNTAIGYHALETDTTGSENTVVGTSAFRNNPNGVRNVSLGINTGYWATGNDNTYIGSYAGQGISGRSTGSSNVAVGDYALFNARSAAQNVAIGESALGSDSTGNLNVAIGAGAMDQRLRGNENVGIGFWAGRADTASVNSVYVGSQAGYNNNRSSTVAIGYQALYNNSVGATVAQALNNVAVGTSALSANTLGSSNTAVGNSALIGNISGSQNTSMGYLSNVSASNLVNATAIGANAFVAQSNTMVLGSINGVNSATADTKVGIGTTTPDSTFSVADKFLVGSSGTVQYDNTVPVMNYMFKSGGSNTDRMVISHSPAFANYGLQYQDASDKFNFLGNGINRMAIELVTGDVGINFANPIHLLQLGTDDAAKPGTATWTIVSDKRLKTINGNYTKGLSDILKLNTIQYTYTASNKFNLPSDKQFVGFTAQEVQKVFPEAVTTDRNGYLNLNLHPILVAYVNAFKEQEQIIEKQQKDIDDVKKKNEQLEKDVQAIKAKLGINN